MQIDIPQHEYDRLTEHAKAAGYANVPAWIAALANEPLSDPRQELSEVDARKNAVECQRVLSEMRSGVAHHCREAMNELGRQRGYTLPE